MITFSSPSVRLVSAILLLLIGGCSSQPNAPHSSERPLTADEKAFAAGNDRSPTASTSYAFARILVRQGRDRDALYILSRIVRDHPKFLPAYNELAEIYVRSDRFDDAVSVLSSGLKQSPQDGVLLNNLGMCYLITGDHTQALQCFTEAAEGTPTNPIFRSNRATALGLLHRDAEAESDYLSVIDSAAAQENLAILARARVAKTPASVNLILTSMAARAASR